MIAIGGAIGVGLFLGSATAIQKAGPGLVVSYAIGGLVIFFIMRAKEQQRQKLRFSC
jgi:amino acid transporter, AAT family